MKKILIILLIVIAAIPTLFIGSAMVIGFYEGITGKIVIPEDNETTSITSKVDKVVSSSNEHKCDFKLKETKKATCQKTGEKVYRCSICNKEKKNKIEKISCDFKLKENKAPNFDDIGHRIYECSMCQKQKTEDYGKIIPPVSFDIIDYSIDFLGGVTHTVKIKNQTSTPIKYFKYTLYYTNAVGDIIYSNLQIGTNPMTWTVTGPIAGNSTTTFSGYGFYNANVKGYIITCLDIEYMDGTFRRILGEDFDNYDKELFFN